MNTAYIPNCITALRIVGTLAMIFTKPFTWVFYAVHFLTGVTDALDGFLARKLKVSSEFGAKLDSVADVFFTVTVIIKILPALLDILPTFVWYLAGVIVILRIASYVASAVKFRKIASLHTVLNKITGFMVFSVPYFIHTPIITVLCTVICIMGIISNVEDFIIHLNKKEYSTDVKTIIQKN